MTGTMEPHTPLTPVLILFLFKSRVHVYTLKTAEVRTLPVPVAALVCNKPLSFTISPLVIWCVGASGCETRILDSRPKLLGFHMSSPDNRPIGQIKRHGKGRRFIAWLRTCNGKR
jgi:hypothetical protein